MTKLYHKDVKLPAGVNPVKSSTLYLVPTRHAREQAELKGFQCPMAVHAGAQLIEVETDIINGKEVVTKALYRERTNSFNDVLMVVRGNRLITCWLNDRRDTHATLDKSKYSAA